MPGGAALRRERSCPCNRRYRPARGDDRLFLARAVGTAVVPPRWRPGARRRTGTTASPGPGIAIKRTTRLPLPQWREGLAVVPLSRAVVDACRLMRRAGDIRGLVAEAVQTRRTTVDRLAAEIRAGESAGTAGLALALEEVGWGAGSVPEMEIARDLRRSALPPAKWNVALLAQDGSWLATPDAWWREANTVLEIDSYRWHLSPADAERTMARRERLTRHGLLVVQISPAQYREDPLGFRARLAETLAVGATLPPSPVIDAVEFRGRAGVAS